MHEAALARAAVPEPAVCMRMLLRPLSLGHVLLLDRHQVFESGGELSPFNVPKAVLICCQTWAENTGAGHDFLLSLKLRLWNWRSRACDLRAEKLVFEDYVRDGCQSFKPSDAPRKTLAVSSEARLPGTPFVLRVQQWLMVYLGLREAAAWDYPFGLATMRWACYWEEEGAFNVYSDHDAQFDKFVAEQEAQKARRASAPEPVAADNPS